MKDRIFFIWKDDEAGVVKMKETHRMEDMWGGGKTTSRVFQTVYYLTKGAINTNKSPLEKWGRRDLFFIVWLLPPLSRFYARATGDWSPVTGVQLAISLKWCKKFAPELFSYLLSDYRNFFFFPPEKSLNVASKPIKSVIKILNLFIFCFNIPLFKLFIKFRMSLLFIYTYEGVFQK